MIGFIRGKLVVKTPPHLTVDVGGVGYDIEAPLSPVMPVRGHLVLDGSARYQCRRRAMEFVCAGEVR